MIECPRVLITKWEKPLRLSTHGEIILKYQVGIGFPGADNLIVGTYRARGFEKLILESSEDIPNLEGQKDERYKVDGVSGNTNNANERLYRMAKTRAHNVSKKTGLEIEDLIENPSLTKSNLEVL